MHKILKACIFATGLAGIVAEYVMSTLASYMLGNAVLQWTLIISLMLFAMGIGSHLSKYIHTKLLDAFVITELFLSVLCAASAFVIYFLSAYIQNISLLIYFIAFCIGVLIGLEIPLATRLNNYFEELRINISSIMEKDYYGALLGGILFAFFALPYLGITYTPIALGMINFIVAFVLFYQYHYTLEFRKSLTAGFACIFLFLIILAITAKPIILYGEQQKYMDRIVYRQQTPYHRIIITQWKDYYWLYLNGNEQFSSYDEERYHEPLVHPAMLLSASRKHVLILGGGDGLAAREVLKYPEVETITLIDIDPAITNLARTHPIFLKLNQNSMNNPRVYVINKDAYMFLKKSKKLYDVIIIDLPDPKTIGLSRLYTREFYQLASRHLSYGGAIVTQATSPFFSRKAFLCILKTMQATGLPAIPYHNNIPTLGEWSWVLGINLPNVNTETIKHFLSNANFDKIKTRFLNKNAMVGMLSFGKEDLKGLDTIKVNNELQLALYHYYKNGSWDLY